LSILYTLSVLKAFDHAAGEDVTNLVLQRNAALILCKLGRTEEAIRRLRNILDLDPDDTQTLQILAAAKQDDLNGEAPTFEHDSPKPLEA
jgi:predicted Zn-dependent protease